MTKIICEIGHNHLGSEKFLFQYLDKLDKKKVSGVTIQLKDPKLYKKLYKNYYLDIKTINKFLLKAKKKFKYVGISTNTSSYLNLLDLKQINFFKILSTHIGNYKLINKIKKTKKKIFLSTGLSTINRVKKIVSKIGKKNIELIHTSFPNSKNSLNLNKIRELKKLGLPLSYGNHSENIKTVAFACFYDVNYIFIYIKDKFNKKKTPFRDNRHAVKIEQIKKIYNDMANYEKYIQF